MRSPEPWLAIVGLAGCWGRGVGVLTCWATDGLEGDGEGDGRGEGKGKRERMSEAEAAGELTASGEEER
jgi:hypothetical protein